MERGEEGVDLPRKSLLVEQGGVVGFGRRLLAILVVGQRHGVHFTREGVAFDILPDVAGELVAADGPYRIHHGGIVQQRQADGDALPELFPAAHGLRIGLDDFRRALRADEIRENADAEVPDGGGRPQCVAQGRIGEDLEQKVYVAGGTGHCPHGIEACGSGVDPGDIALPLCGTDAVQAAPARREPDGAAGVRADPPGAVTGCDGRRGPA